MQLLNYLINYKGEVIWMKESKLTFTAVVNLISWNTLTASLFPVLIGAVFSDYYYHEVSISKMIIYAIVAVTLHLIVNVLDNLDDYTVANQEHADELLQINPVHNFNLTKHQVKKVVTVMLVIVVGLGLWLVQQTAWPLLVLGIIGLIVGLTYSKFFQNTPMGEILSGIIMGFLITFAAVYINTYQSFQWTWNGIWPSILISLPNVFWIANMMLANNICDIDYDKKCGRKTFPISVGKKNAIFTFNLLNVLAFIALILAVVLHFAPWTLLLTLILIPFVYQQCKIFTEKQIKSSTFLAAVKILGLGSLVQFITFLIGLF